MTLLEVLDDEKRKQYREKKRSTKNETLYHRTNIDALTSMLKDGKLKASRMPSLRNDEKEKYAVCSARKWIYNRIDAPKNKDSYEADELSDSVGLVELIIDKDKLISGNIVKGLRKPKPYAEFVDDSKRREAYHINNLYSDVMKNYKMYYSGIHPEKKPTRIYSVLAEADKKRRSTSSTESSIRFLKGKNPVDDKEENNIKKNIENKTAIISSTNAEADKLEKYVKDYIARNIDKEVRAYARLNKKIMSNDYYTRNNGYKEAKRYLERKVKVSPILSQFLLVDDFERNSSLINLINLFVDRCRILYYSSTGRESEERLTKKDYGYFDIPFNKGIVKIRLLKGFYNSLIQDRNKSRVLKFIEQVIKNKNLFVDNEELRNLLSKNKNLDEAYNGKNYNYNLLQDNIKEEKK